MSEVQTPKRRSTDQGIELETRVSILETRQEFLTETIANIAKSLEKHIDDEERTMRGFTDIVSEMNKTVIINTEALRHLAATFVTQSVASDKLTAQITELDKRVDSHEIKLVKVDTVGITIIKVASVVSVIIGAIWAIASKFIGN